MRAFGAGIGALLRALLASGTGMFLSFAGLSLCLTVTILLIIGALGLEQFYWCRDYRTVKGFKVLAVFTILGMVAGYMYGTRDLAAMVR